jgi:hypothetical protein
VGGIGPTATSELRVDGQIVETPDEGVLVDPLATKTGLIIPALATLALALAGCAGETSAPAGAGVESAPAAVEASAATDGGDDPPADAAAAEDVAEDPAPEEASEAAAMADAGAPAAPGQGSLDVGGTTYDLTIASCTFNDDGPAEGTFEVKGSDADGHNFEMTQFFLGGDWSQSDVQLDLDNTKIYVISSSARDGAEPATVDGKNITWVADFRELDEAANSQVELGSGVLNLTCA